jgi:hypothetical protein
LRGIRKVSLFTRYKCVLLFHRQFTMSPMFSILLSIRVSWTPNSLSAPLLNQTQPIFFCSHVCHKSHTTHSWSHCANNHSACISHHAESRRHFAMQLYIGTKSYLFRVGGVTKAFWVYFLTSIRWRGVRGVSLLLSFPFQTFTTPPGRGGGGHYHVGLGGIKSCYWSPWKRKSNHMTSQEKPPWDNSLNVSLALYRLFQKIDPNLQHLKWKKLNVYSHQQTVTEASIFQVSWIKKRSQHPKHCRPRRHVARTKCIKPQSKSIKISVANF